MKKIRPTRLDLELAELERTNPAVRAAAEKLERVKREIIAEGKKRREQLHPCRSCPCTNFGYELGDHPGICFCTHDDMEHRPRQSALRRWLRTMAAADNWARVEEERNERERRDRATASDALSAVFGYPIEVLPPAGFTFPHFAVSLQLTAGVGRAQDGLRAAQTPTRSTHMTADELATFQSKTAKLVTDQQTVDAAVIADSAAKSALSSAQSSASSAASALASANASVLADEQDLVTFVDGLIAEAGVATPAPSA